MFKYADQEIQHISYTDIATFKPVKKKAKKASSSKASPNKSVQSKAGSTCSRGGTEENQHIATFKHGNQAVQHTHTHIYIHIYIYIVGDRLKSRNSVFPGFQIFTLLST